MVVEGLGWSAPGESTGESMGGGKTAVSISQKMGRRGLRAQWERLNNSWGGITEQIRLHSLPGEVVD